MSKFFRALCVLMTILVLLGAAGCGGSGRQALYGKWEIVSGASRAEWEFKENGDFRMEVGGDFEMGGDSSIFETSFQFVDDDTILLVAPEGFGGEDARLDFRIEGDQLTLTSQGGDSITFDRVK